MKILILLGTRPEAIKLIPVYSELKKHSALEVKLCVTSQQRHLQDQILKPFGIRADFDLNLMVDNQSLSTLTSNIISSFSQILLKEVPDWVIVHGDTTTAFAGCLSAFYQKIKIAHVEAGLRSKDLSNPFPEELNRVFIDRISSTLFAPTESARINLISEGLSEQSIHVTGNTAIDMIHYVAKQDLHSNADIFFAENGISTKKHIVLLTMHRRENIGSAIGSVCKAIIKLAVNQDVQFVMPVHPNPNVRSAIEGFLSGFENIFLVKPLDYLTFVGVMSKAYIIITDSGGIQEEAPSLNVPVLVVREKTERSDAIDSGAAKLVGTDTLDVFNEVTKLLQDDAEHAKMASARSPYGDGKASRRIAEYFLSRLASEKVQ